MIQNVLFEGPHPAQHRLGEFVPRTSESTSVPLDCRVGCTQSLLSLLPKQSVNCYADEFRLGTPRSAEKLAYSTIQFAIDPKGNNTILTCLCPHHFIDGIASGHPFVTVDIAEDAFDESP